MSRYNDLDMSRWKEYDDIDRRDNSGVHTGKYHGNFVPQIPYQLFSRYTQKGDWILDAFMGSGTSLIEAQRMGRNSIGIELQERVAEEAENRIRQEENGCTAKVIVGDSRFLDLKCELDRCCSGKVQFVIMHPPYWDIIKFSDSEADLSNAGSLDAFMDSLGKVIDNTTQYLEKDRYCACIIGDKYAKGQVIPLGFLCMNKFLEKGFTLKGIVCKNMGETKGKANQQGIWRYRALANDFFIFKHEYVFVFKK